MDQYLPHLLWINETKKHQLKMLTEWASIHTGSHHLSGLAILLEKLKQAFSSLEGEIEVLPLLSKKYTDQGILIDQPLGQALKITKYPEKETQILLGGHMDIAFSENQKLPPLQQIDEDTLTGRGTADMKGGLVILLTALQALERSPFAGKMGWQVLIVPDEEIGSPGSRILWQEMAKKKKLAFLFEPSLPDGSLVSSRKGSMNFTLQVRGRAAHVGREFGLGQNAITSCCRFAAQADKLSNLEKEITVNIGSIRGGGPVNIVPDWAELRFNVRCATKEALKETKETLKQLAAMESRLDDLQANVFQDSERPPKLFDKKTRALFESLKGSAEHLGMDLRWKPSGGACDGNLIADQGTTTIDTLGAIGGNLHTEEEYVILSSLQKRAQLAARFLMQIAAGEI